jgi:signal transduction histidine kinase
VTTGGTSVSAFFFTFPDGRFIPRWSWALISLWLANFAFWLAPVNSPLNIFGWHPLLKYLWLFVVFGGSLATQVYRYRRVASEVERQQIKWLIYGLVPTLLLPICFQLAVALFPALGSPSALLGVATEPLWRFYFLPIPFCIGIALLRYHLWDIDVLINRTLVYGTLTMSVIGLYMLVVVSLGSFVQAQGNLLLSLLATGFIAVLFQPLRAFLQRGINRLLYGLRDEPYVVLARLGQRLKTTLDPDAVLSTIVATVREALKLSYAAIEVQEGTAVALAASSGTPPAQETLRLLLAYQNETVGTLIIAPRGRDDALTPADLRLLDDLTQQIGNAVHTVRLTSDLQRSREHLITAREEERRRLRRDLHDGLGPMLSAIMLKVGLVRTLHRRDPETTDVLLNQLEAEIESVIGDIRHVVYNLRPPALDELGLVGSIREYFARLGTEAQGQDAVLTVTGQVVSDPSIPSILLSSILPTSK